MGPKYHWTNLTFIICAKHPHSSKYVFHRINHSKWWQIIYYFWVNYSFKCWPCCLVIMTERLAKWTGFLYCFLKNNLFCTNIYCCALYCRHPTVTPALFTFFKYAESTLGNKQLLYECSWTHKMCCNACGLVTKYATVPYNYFLFSSLLSQFWSKSQQSKTEWWRTVFKSSVYILKVIFHISCLGGA